MIFEPDKLNDRKYKAQFIELVSVYVRLVECFAEKHDVKITHITEYSPDMEKEMSEIGVIDDKTSIRHFEHVIGHDLASRFRDSVAFSLEYKIELGNLLDKLNNKKRLELQKIELVSGKPNLVDFFAGAGGISCGFVKAGYRLAFANDLEDVCVRTYKYNHPELPSEKIIEADIRKIVNYIEDYISEPIDVVVGGPPCQGFSSANKQRIINDPRNELYKYYIEAIKKILPKFVIMENVPGMLPVADQVLEDYEEISEVKNGKCHSYKVSYKLLNSSDFSVAQARERLFFIAIRNDIVENHNITPDEIFIELSRVNAGKRMFVLKDALDFIVPLKAPRIKNQNEVDSDITGKKITVNTYHGDDSAYLWLINGGRKIPYVYNHKARYVNNINYDIYRLLEPGDDASDEKIAHIMPYKHRLHCFKDKYFKLIPDKPSRTITAHMRMDCHSHIHPFQIRALTPREAARCQSFPDDYLFLGAYLKTYMQIGNAVPVLMAEEIANVIKKYLI
ncbi:MAG: DNA cytosine methyltransferase [Peptococcia bacterium]|jgi:DNA (cytosine-5)-methyltransferase 1